MADPPFMAEPDFGTGKNVVLPISSAGDGRHRSFRSRRSSAQPMAGRPKARRWRGRAVRREVLAGGRRAGTRDAQRACNMDYDAES